MKQNSHVDWWTNRKPLIRARAHNCPKVRSLEKAIIEEIKKEANAVWVKHPTVAKTWILKSN
jgi:hypothetical protein